MNKKNKDYLQKLMEELKHTEKILCYAALRNELK